MGSCQCPVRVTCSEKKNSHDLSTSSPKTKEELFNLRHASARNVIERIFGVLKQRFRILLLAPQYSLKIQSQIPAALCAVHNFIRIHSTSNEEADEADWDDGEEARDGNDDDSDFNQAVDLHEDADAREWRDEIARMMWSDYQ